MQVEECDFPRLGVLDRRLVEAAFFRDSYRTPLNQTQANVVEEEQLQRRRQSRPLAILLLDAKRTLDFRLSMLKEVNGEAMSAVISTACTTHNAFGRIYMFFIIPFHKWGVRRLISRAVAAGGPRGSLNAMRGIVE
jgi:Protein of unknown function (DUF2867)